MTKWRAIGALALAASAVLSGAAAASAEPAHRHRTFDLQAHRGGLGLRPESTLASFANGLQVGVTTLEMDLQITKDNQVVVTHDRKVDGSKCLDTSPAFPADPQFPYVGKFVNTLTLAEVKTLDCGTKTLPNFPEQVPAPGARMPLLREVFDLVKRYHAYGVKMNIETKVEAGSPTETAPMEQFVQGAVREIRRAHMLRQVTIQSFDWGSLIRMHQVEPRLPLVALDNKDFLQVGQPGMSPWLGGIDIDDFGGDPLLAIKSFGGSAWSPVHGNPQGGTVNDPGYQPYTTADMVAEAHRLGLKVIPWTIDDQATVNKLIDDGVDGIITDYPDRLRTWIGERGFALPKQYHAPRRDAAA
ncbi:MAG TPA: glycerophosphodiester phosphodiesterase family protein [Jatrophihabitantaceae bacterium]